MEKPRRLNDATPEEWNALRNQAPAIEKTGLESWMAAAHREMDIEPDMVTSPAHYNNGGIEAIDAIQASMSPIEFRGYLKGNCMKYLWRYDYKGKQVEDLRKTGWYLDKLTALVAEENS